MRFPGSHLVWSEPLRSRPLSLMSLLARNIRRLQVIVLCAIAALAAIFAVPAQAATYPAGFEERTIASGLTGPVGVAWTPDGRMLVIEKDGRLKVAPAAGGAPTTVLDITGRVNSYWDRGLLGVAVDSAFASNRYIYLLYTYDVNPLTPDGSGAAISRLSRFELSPTNQVSNEAVLLGTWTGGACPAPSNTVDCIPSEGASHSIGSVRSAPDGTLYVGSGDASSFSNVDPTRAAHLQRAVACPARSSTSTATAAGSPATRSARPTRTSTTSARSSTRRASATRTGSSSARTGAWSWATWAGTPARRSTSSAREARATAGPATRARYARRATAPSPRAQTEYAKEGTANAHAPPVHDYLHNGASAAILAGPDLSGERVPHGLPRHDLLRRLRRRLHQEDPRGRERLCRSGGGLRHELDRDGLEAAPNGDLVFTDFGDGSPGTGSLKRVAYSPGNGSPTAQAAGTPSSGAAPLAVQFSSAGSIRPERRSALVLVGLRRRRHEHERQPGPHLHGAGRLDGHPDRERRPRPLRHEDGAGVGRRLRAHRDDQRPGRRVALSRRRHDHAAGSATDPEDGVLAPSRLSWNVVIHHSSHIHQVGSFNGVAQASFQTLRDHDADSYYEITLRATDSSGLTTTRTVDIRPETVPLQVGERAGRGAGELRRQLGDHALQHHLGDRLQHDDLSGHRVHRGGRAALPVRQLVGRRRGESRHHDAGLGDNAHGPLSGEQGLRPSGHGLVGGDRPRPAQRGGRRPATRAGARWQRTTSGGWWTSACPARSAPWRSTGRRPTRRATRSSPRSTG